MKKYITEKINIESLVESIYLGLCASLSVRMLLELFVTLN